MWGGLGVCQALRRVPFSFVPPNYWLKNSRFCPLLGKQKKRKKAFQGRGLSLNAGIRPTNLLGVKKSRPKLF
jgi:hypothetical protein